MKASDIPKSLRILDKGDGQVTALAITGDSRWLLMSRAADVRLWNLKRAKPDTTPVVLKATRPEISRDSRWMAALTSDATVRLWSLTGDDPSSHSFQVNDQIKPVSRWTFSADSRFLIVSSEDRLQVWDVSAKVPEPRPLIDKLGGRIDQVHGSPDGKWVATVGQRLHLVDLSSLQPKPAAQLLASPFLLNVQFTPDGRWLLTTNSGQSRLWNLRSSDPAAKSFLLGDAVGAAVVSADGHWLATTSARSITDPPDPRVRLWDLTRPDPTASPFLLLGHERSIPAMEISPDGQWLITGADDATLRFWNLRADDPSASPLVIPAGNKAGSLFATPDSRFVASRGEDGSLRFWHLRLGELLARAQSVSGRNLSLEEWPLFFQGQPYRKTFATLPAPKPLK